MRETPPRINLHRLLDRAQIRQLSARSTWRGVGSRQLGLGILMHEGAHGGLAKNAALNDWIAQWLCAAPVWAEALGYRRYHLKHHDVAQTKDDQDPWRVARTTHAGLLARAFFAPYWVNYHAEHHILLYVPCYRLRQMQQMFRENGLIDRLQLAPGYAAVMRMATSR